jgi:hypothetical protein
MAVEIGKQQEEVKPETPPAEDKVSKLYEVVEGLGQKLEEIKTIAQTPREAPQPVAQPVFQPQLNNEQLTQAERQTYENIRLTQSDYDAGVWLNNLLQQKQYQSRMQIDQYWNNAVAKDPRIAPVESSFKREAYALPPHALNDFMLGKLIPLAFGDYNLNSKQEVKENPKPKEPEGVTPPPSNQQPSTEYRRDSESTGGKSELDWAKKFGQSEEAYKKVKAEAKAKAAAQRR